jgi:hypothetical protein
MSAFTLRNLERGNSGVTIGAYLAVMQVLVIEQDLDLVAKVDEQGHEFQDAKLSKLSTRPSVHTSKENPAPPPHLQSLKQRIQRALDRRHRFHPRRNLANLIARPGTCRTR